MRFPPSSAILVGPLAFSLLLCRLQAFAPTSRTLLHRPAARTTTRIGAGSLFLDDDSSDSSSFDVEAARKHLESIIAQASFTNGPSGAVDDEHHLHRAADASTTTTLQRFSSNNNKNDEQRYDAAELSSVQVRTSSSPSSFASSPPVVLPPPPVLTAMDRARRRKELELLAQLADDDHDASAELWALWFQERGPRAAAQLFQAETWASEGTPQSLKSAEQLLHQLIDEYGVHWAEPVHRLATLHLVQGRFDQAEILCRTVLAVKPWHFGALSTIVRIYEGQRNADSARLWAARRMPSWTQSGINKRRHAWVEQAVQNAEQALMDAEQRVRLAFGEPDDHVIPANDRLRRLAHEGVQGGDEDDDAWQ